MMTQLSKTPTEHLKVVTQPKCDVKDCEEIAVVQDSEGYWCDTHYWCKAPLVYRGFDEYG